MDLNKLQELMLERNLVIRALPKELSISSYTVPLEKMNMTGY